MKSKELYKLALYLVLKHLDSKLVKFENNKFTLLSGSVCKCYILDYDTQFIKITYKTLFGECGINCNNVKFYVYIKPKYDNNNLFIYDYEFFIIDTNIIRQLSGEWQKMYKQNVKGIFKKFYKFEYKLLKSYGKLLRF